MSGNIIMLEIETLKPEIFLGENFSKKENLSFNLQLPTFTEEEIKNIEEIDGETLLENNWSNTFISFQEGERGATSIFVEFDSSAIFMGFPLYERLKDIDGVQKVEVFIATDIEFGYQTLGEEYYFDRPEFFMKPDNNIVLLEKSFNSEREEEVYKNAFEILFGESTFLKDNNEYRKMKEEYESDTTE